MIFSITTTIANQLFLTRESSFTNYGNCNNQHIHSRQTKKEVEEVIASEGYRNTSEFFRDLVGDYLGERQERKLAVLLIEGLESGDAAPLTKADSEDIKKTVH